MKVKANISFTGMTTMTAGEVREIVDENILTDLLQSGYVIPVEIQAPETQAPETTPEPEDAPVQQKKKGKKKMKIPELTNDNITSFLKLDNYEDLDESEQEIINLNKESAFSYIQEETGLSPEQIEDTDDLTVAYLSLCQDFYDNRALQIDKNTVNNTVDTILSRHRINLI